MLIAIVYPLFSPLRLSAGCCQHSQALTAQDAC